MEVFNPFIFVYDVSKVSSIILLKNYLLIFWLDWIFIVVRGLSPVAINGLLFFAVHRFLIAVASLVQHKL